MIAFLVSVGYLLMDIVAMITLVLVDPLDVKEDVDNDIPCSYFALATVWPFLIAIGMVSLPYFLANLIYKRLTSDCKDREPMKGGEE